MNDTVKQKLLDWSRRYLPAELCSVAVTMLAAMLAYQLTGSNLSTALVATWLGSGVFYAYILAQDMRLARRQCQAQGRCYTVATFRQNVRALLVEFGIAEGFDLVLIRPCLMYYLPLWLGNLAVGTLVAKFAADLTFYVPAIIGYELSKRWFRDFR